MTHRVLGAAQVGLAIAMIATLGACLGGGAGLSADERRLQGTWTVTKYPGATQETCRDGHCEVTVLADYTDDYDITMSFSSGTVVTEFSPAAEGIIVGLEAEYVIDAMNSTITSTITDVVLTAEYAQHKAQILANLANSNPVTYAYSFPASNRLRLEYEFGVIEAKRSS